MNRNDEEKQDTEMTDTSTSRPGPSNEMQAIHFRLPQFWKQNARTWFVAAEVQFTLGKITSDTTKFSQIILALEPETCETVLDIIENPPATDKYIALKNALITRNSPSETRQLRHRRRKTLGNVKANSNSGRKKLYAQNYKIPLASKTPGVCANCVSAAGRSNNE